MGPNGLNAPALLLRPGEAADEQAAIEVIRAAMSTYSDWCPGWSLPRDMEARERARWRTGDSSSQRLVACVGERVVGVSVSKQASIAVLSLLMVAPTAWGTEVAARLHDCVLREAAARSSIAIRLTVPEGNGRARRFYEKNGWQRTSMAARTHSWLGLPMLEYARDLTSLET
jgi:GNAT superfamily N-acetyltransferase